MSLLCCVYYLLTRCFSAFTLWVCLSDVTHYDTALLLNLNSSGQMKYITVYYHKLAISNIHVTIALVITGLKHFENSWFQLNVANTCSC